jgi:DNA-binding response OmpR family regulator
MVRPSCPALVIHEDDAFRKKLIATLDQNHFTVSMAPDGDGALELLSSRKFSVVLLGVNLDSESGMRSLRYLHAEKPKLHCGVIILGDPHPQIRSYAPWADETLLKPVDAEYVTARARTYCDCTP